MDRDVLEAQAKEICPAELWYDLMDMLGETSDEDLLQLINEYGA